MPDLEGISLYETSVDDTGIATLAKLSKLRSVARSCLSNATRSRALGQRNGRIRLSRNVRNARVSQAKGCKS